jgi:hypothetical protein
VLLAAVGCDNDVEFGSLTPQWTNPALGERALQIAGSLEARDGSCLEATILYDGKELVDARAVCPGFSECARLELEAITRTLDGHHTISFQVLRQSEEVIDYLVEGTVLVTRDGLSLGGVTMPLEPTRASLRAGDVVTFDIEFTD